MLVLMVGTPGRSPFAGHFRGGLLRGAVELRWAGRVRGQSPPEEAWGAAELVRDALAGVEGADRYTIVQAAWNALRPLDTSDLSVLFVARDAEGMVVAASGLEDVRADGQRLAPTGHPLFDEPGVRERPGFFHPDRAAATFVALPVGARWPSAELELACGYRGTP